MIDLSSPEPTDAEYARCYVIHEQNILISAGSGTGSYRCCPRICFVNIRIIITWAC